MAKALKVKEIDKVLETAPPVQDDGVKFGVPVPEEAALPPVETEFDDAPAETVEDMRAARQVVVGKPKIVCLCGSMRFTEQMDREAIKLTLASTIVLMPHFDDKRMASVFAIEVPCNSCFGKSGLITICTKCNHTGRMKGVDKAKLEEVKLHLDELHLRKIDLADEVRFINAGGYFGASTTAELTYAASVGKVITMLEPRAVPTTIRAIFQAAEYSHVVPGTWQMTKEFAPAK